MGDRRERIIELASRRVRHAIIRVHLEDRRPGAIVGAEFGYLSLDASGRPNREERSRLFSDSLRLYDAYMKQEKAPCHRAGRRIGEFCPSRSSVRQEGIRPQAPLAAIR